MLCIVLLVALFVPCYGEHYAVTSFAVGDVAIGGSVATVTRDVHVESVQSGAHILVVDDLPSVVDDTSIVIKSRDGAAVTSTTLMLEDHAQANDEGFRNLTHSLESIAAYIDNVISIIDTDISDASSRRGVISKFVDNTLLSTVSNINPVSLSPEQLSAILDHQDREQRLLREQHMALSRLRTVLVEWQSAVKVAASALTRCGAYHSANLRTLRPLPDDPHSAHLAHLESDLQGLVEQLAALPVGSKHWPETQRKKQLRVLAQIPESAVEGGEQ